MVLIVPSPSADDACIRMQECCLSCERANAVLWYFYSARQVSSMVTSKGTSPRRCDHVRCGQVHILVPAAVADLMFLVTFCHAENVRNARFVSMSSRGGAIPASI